MASEEVPSLESLLNKATNPSNQEDDWEAIMAFCDQINKELEGPQIAVRLLAHKIQSPQDRESLYALTALEACVKNCGKRFHQEIGKFRFLNEVIKVVSPKYLGNHTTEKVKTRCIEILYSWSQCLKHEPKILEAYQMLKKQGIVKKDPVHTDKTFEPPPERQKNKNSIFEDDEKSKLLSRLLRSNHPEDLQAANRLIKNMVKQDAERMEKKSRRVSELETVGNNVKLLTEMLEHYAPDSTSAADIDLMKELYENLEKQRPALFRLASDTDEKDTDGINSILAANDDVLRVMTRYKSSVEGTESNLLMDTSTKGKGDADLVDLASDGKPLHVSESKNLSSNSSTSNLFDDQLMGLGSAEKSDKAESNTSDLEMLSDIFGTTAGVPAASSSNPLDSDLFGLNTAPSQAIGGLDSSLNMAVPGTSPGSGSGFSAFISSGQSGTPPLSQTSNKGLVTSAAVSLGAMSGTGTPVNVTPTHTATSILQPTLTNQQGVVTGILTGSSAPLLPSQPTAAAAATSTTTGQPNQKSAFDDLDALGQSLLQSSLPPNFKPAALPGAPPKVPMNQMQKSTPGATSLLDGLSQPTTPAVKALSQTILTSSPIATPTGSAHASPKHVPAQNQVKSGTVEVQSLSELFVPLDTIKPGTAEPLSAYDKNGLKVVMHFGKDTPRPDVLVLVVSTMSTNTSPVKNFTFQAAVPKTMRVKLQPPSATDLPAYNPILPPAAITQVMLIANPNKEKIRLKFKISFTMDGSSQTDVGEVDGFPIQ